MEIAVLTCTVALPGVSRDTRLVSTPASPLSSLAAVSRLGREEAGQEKAILEGGGEMQNLTCTKYLRKYPNYSPAGCLGMVHRLAVRSGGEDQRGSWTEILHKYECNTVDCMHNILLAGCPF